MKNGLRVLSLKPFIFILLRWLRGADSNGRPLGYENAILQVSKDLFVFILFWRAYVYWGFVNVLLSDPYLTLVTLN